MVEAWQLEINGNENFGIDYHGEEAGLKLSISYQACVRVAQSYFSFCMYNTLAGVPELWVLTYQLHLHGDI